MRKSRNLTYIKGLLGVIALMLFSFVKVDIAKAETFLDIADTNVSTVSVKASDPIDMEVIMNAITDKEITNGDSFIVDDKYQIDCVVSFKTAPSSGISIQSISNSYSASCTVYVSSLLTQTHVATIYHTVNITYSDSGLVHINTGSLSVSTYVSYYSGSGYGYSINNTDGTNSSASGMVQLYNSKDQKYIYYGASVSVSRGGSPSFNFSQV